MANKVLHSFLNEKLSSLKESGLFNQVNIMEGANGPTIHINGQEFINISSNNYLGFANDNRLKVAAIEAICLNGVGSGGSRILNGTSTIHIELEEKIAEFKGTESAITYPSGFYCNTTTIPALLDRNDAIILDELNHVSIFEGGNLSKADIISYEHSNMQDLRRKAEKAFLSGNYNKIMVVTAGVFSMDGDLAKLPEIVKIAEEFELITYVDDAHGSGVLGNGSGTVKHFNLQDKIDIQMGTLSKALGVVGGYIAGKKDLTEWLRMSSSFFRYTTAIPPAEAKAGVKAIELLMKNPEIVEKLWSNNKYFENHLKNLGFNTGNSESGIIPCIIGDEKVTQEFSNKLYNLGIFASPLVFPSVPKGKGRIRNIIIATHTEKMMNDVLKAYETIGKEMMLI